MISSTGNRHQLPHLLQFYDNVNFRSINILDITTICFVSKLVFKLL